MGNAQLIPAFVGGNAQLVPAWLSPATNPPQLLSPISDISQGLWTPSSGSDLYAMLDEETASDTDYIVSSSGSSCEMMLAVGATPAAPGAHVLRYRLLDGSGSVLVSLKQGSTVLASWGPHTLTGVVQDLEQTLTTEQIATITDYSDLRVVFEAE